MLTVLLILSLVSKWPKCLVCIYKIASLYPQTRDPYTFYANLKVSRFNGRAKYHLFNSTAVPWSSASACPVCRSLLQFWQ